MTYAKYHIKQTIADHYDCKILSSSLFSAKDFVSDYAKIKGISTSHTKLLISSNEMSYLKRPNLGPNTKIILEFWKYYDKLNLDSFNYDLSPVDYSHIMFYWLEIISMMDTTIIEQALYSSFDRQNTKNFVLYIATCELLYDSEIKPFLQYFKFTY